MNNLTLGLKLRNRIMFGDDALLAENARKAMESIEGSRATEALIKAFAKAE